MGHLLKREKLLRYNFVGIGKLSLIAVLVTFSASFVDTIWAVFLYGYLKNNAYVGFFSAFLTLISFISFFWFIPLIEKNDKDKLFIAAIVFSIVSYLLFAVVKNIYLIFFVALLSTLAINLRIASFGIIVRDNSNKKELVKINVGIPEI